MPAPPTPTTLQPGQQVRDAYVVEALLGADEDGRLFKAHHARLEHQVTIRFLSMGIGGDMVPRVERAAALMGRIRHPNVVAILDYWVEPDGRPAIVTEHVEGESLRRYLHRSGALEWHLACRLMLRVLRGLAAIHEAGVVHRNVKPETVLLIKGGDELVRLTGLSFAKSLTDPSFKRITTRGAPVGTPAYISPEQLKGQEVEFTTDIYSAGLLLYEMLAGTPPERKPSLKQLLARGEKAPPPPMAPLGMTRIPPPLQDLVTRMLAPRPNDRPGSAREVQRALLDIGEALGIPLEAEPDVVLENAPVAPRDRSRLRVTASTQPPEPEDLEPDADVDAGRTYQAQALVAARLPPLELAKPQVRTELAAMVAEGAVTFSVGAIYWVGLVSAGGSAEAGMAELKRIRAGLRSRFGADTPLASRLVDDTFVLTDASLSGKAAPPIEVMNLLDVVASL